MLSILGFDGTYRHRLDGMARPGIAASVDLQRSRRASSTSHLFILSPIFAYPHPHVAVHHPLAFPPHAAGTFCFNLYIRLLGNVFHLLLGETTICLGIGLDPPACRCSLPAPVSFDESHKAGPT
jgi:hypothetical protein